MNTVFIAGHNGMVGSAILRQLKNHDDIRIIKRDRHQLDLTNQSAVHEFFAAEKINQVYLAAARVGGIYANETYPADFIFDNLAIQINLIGAAYKSGVDRLLFLGSSCIYPKFADQPMNEAALLSSKLEPTNEPYAIAKIAGIKLCESFNRQYGTDFRSVMPTNLYGVNDNFQGQNSHVIPALMRRIHESKQANDARVSIWGSGIARREFLNVDDMAAACIYVMNLKKQILESAIEPTLSHLNIGTGEDISIRELAETMARVVGFDGELEFDSTKPDGTPRKLLDVQLIHRLGWKHKIDLESGLKQTYQWYCENQADIRR